MERQAKQITKNLFLGSRKDIPKDADLIISCAAEIYDQYQDDPIAEQLNADIFKIDNRYFYRWPDYPQDNEIDTNQIKHALNLIKNNIADKKIYVHCVWGINRSASLVFMYLLKTKFILEDNFEQAINKYCVIYNNYGPNPGWYNYIKNNFDSIRANNW
ncbi:dual specificity protein phosphatase [Spiroplasma endosymbiont of Amphibalanus improvisus]|uniref:dual specificity protein phosphatase family protein n=1 Tax=Spiroplasma endosymbiont of Amphibalanus improvisus TaxID=3066327 RepID=UPI00313DC970